MAYVPGLTPVDILALYGVIKDLVESVKHLLFGPVDVVE